MVSKRRARNGFTLLETLVVLAIIGVILVFAIPALYSMFQSYKVKTVANQMAIQIRMARNLCVTRKTDYQVVIRSEDSSTGPNSYLVQEAASGPFSDVPNVDTTVPSGVRILSTGIFSGGVATLRFTTRGKIISTAGTPPYLIDIEGVDQLRYRVTVDPTGSVAIEQN